MGEAIRLSVENQDSFRFIAGGTDLLVNKFQGNEQSECLIDITAIHELKSNSVQNKMLKIGSLVTLDALAGIPEIISSFPALIEAAISAASPVLRKSATIGGNILCENRCSFYNQSEWWREAVGYCLKCDGDVCIATGGKKKCFSRFVSDTAPVLIACDAQIEVEDRKGTQMIPLEKIYTGDGIKPRNLSSTALIRNICLPLNEKYECVFMKLRPRESMDFTSLTTAVSVSSSGRVRIVIGGVDPRPVVITGGLYERDELMKKAIKTPRIIDNDVYSRPYRKEMIGVFVNRSFEKLELSGCFKES